MKHIPQHSITFRSNWLRACETLSSHRVLIEILLDQIQIWEVISETYFLLVYKSQIRVTQIFHKTIWISINICSMPINYSQWVHYHETDYASRNSSRSNWPSLMGLPTWTSRHVDILRDARRKIKLTTACNNSQRRISSEWRRIVMAFARQEIWYRFHGEATIY